MEILQKNFNDNLKKLMIFSKKNYVKLEKKFNKNFKEFLIK